MTGTGSGLGRQSRHSIPAELKYRGLLGLTAITDALPARLRFGHWQGVLSTLAPRGGLPTIPRKAARSVPAAPSLATQKKTDLRCLLVAGALDSGGVEAVVSALALGLPREGIAVEVVATQEGRVSDQLRAAGVHVTQCIANELTELIAQVRPDVVELHRPDPGLIAALLPVDIPVVPVFHAMESYLTDATWALLAEMVRRAPLCVAVSGGVRAFFQTRLETARVAVVVNGVPPVPTAPPYIRDRARRDVGEAIGKRISDGDVLVVGLQRYSDQKNAAGLVDAFLQAADSEPRLRLVLAGAPDNWLEVRRADSVRRTSQHFARVHLLGDSDSETILHAGDVYALDSFAEGGPLTAVEAVIHGLPVVLSDVGFATALVASPGVRGEVVPRANHDFSQAAMSTQRRRRHQSNRDDFSAALVRAVEIQRGVAGLVPDEFTEHSMVAGHAAAIRQASLKSSIN